MDSTTHTHMQANVKRAAAPGSLGQRSSYYPNDSANDPPPSPTAKWKGGVHGYEDPKKDPNRFPYMPHPYPLKRRGRAANGHPGGFMSLQEPLQPPKFPDEDQLYCTYAEWWQAQRPAAGPVDDKEATFSTSFWPYGRKISAVMTMDKEDQHYNLDKRVVKNGTFYKYRRPHPGETQGVSFQKSRSSAELMGSQAEHFGYHRSLGRTQSSHASASFHEQNPMPAGQPYATSSVGKSKNMWDSLRANASTPNLATAGQRAESAPSTSRSQHSSQGQAGNSRYDTTHSLRKLGLGSRTNAEWCLPQPPAYANH